MIGFLALFKILIYNWNISYISDLKYLIRICNNIFGFDYISGKQ